MLTTGKSSITGTVLPIPISHPHSSNCDCARCHQIPEPFWQGLKEIARRHRMTVSELVGFIDSQRQYNNLSSALRLSGLIARPRARARSVGDHNTISIRGKYAVSDPRFRRAWPGLPARPDWPHQSWPHHLGQPARHLRARAAIRSSGSVSARRPTARAAGGWELVKVML